MEKPSAALPPQPPSERHPDIKVSGSLARCPYCHEDVSLDTAWVACAECLARHHTDCWDEGGRCSSCSGTERLTREGRGSNASRYPRLSVKSEGELPGGRQVLGRPFRSTFRSTLEGELNPAGESHWLTAEVRRSFKLKGGCQVTPSQAEWVPNDQGCRSIKARIAARNGQTTVEVEENFLSLLGLLGGLGLGGGVGTLSPLLALVLGLMGFDVDGNGWLVGLPILLIAAFLFVFLIAWYRRLVDQRRDQLRVFTQRLAQRISTPAPDPTARPRPAQDAKDTGKG